MGGSVLALAVVMVTARWRLRQQAIRRSMAEREFAAILAERNRVAREIHDTLAQGLGAISIQLELTKSDLDTNAIGAKNHVEQAHKLVRQSLSDARDAIWNMRSQVLETGDLCLALHGILAQMVQGSAVKSELKIQGQARRLPPVTENALLRIGQEAITNAVKHARARAVMVHLAFVDGIVRLSVQDDGQGFQVDNSSPRRGGFGILGMRERASQVHGEFDIKSRPGNGTIVMVTVPAPI
jgi:signal transduction histidine kinase